MIRTSELITWNHIKAIIGPTFKANYTYPSIVSATPPNPVISTGAPRILLPAMPIASRVLRAIRLSEATVFINAFLT